MGLKQQAIAAIGTLPSGGPHRLETSEAGAHLACEVLSHDALACALGELAVTRDDLATAELDELSRVAEALSKQLTYLLEPIQPLEVDAQQCVVQMRSVPPQKDDDGTCYYELLVRRGGTLALVRYRQVPGTPREVIPATLTIEVFGRLVGDFASVKA